MTTTTTYKGFGGEDKPSSRILKPPGGGSSDIFGGHQPMPTSPKSAANRAATSSIFAPAELDVLPKRSNPPGGKSSGIFDNSTTNKAVQQHSHPPGGKGSYAFGIGSLEPTRNQNPNKPVDSNIFGNDSSQSPGEFPISHTRCTCRFHQALHLPRPEAKCKRLFSFYFVFFQSFFLIAQNLR
uniref:Microtubule-associated protein Jupiter n=1 Tax=Eptatretus burgeri TaxID=7764 RepID=A0A8C4R1R7_EPTBU